MTMPVFFKKLIYYYKKHGILKLSFLACIRARRALLQNQDVMFYLDCSELSSNRYHSENSFKVERYEKIEDIPQKYLDRFYRLKGGDKMIQPFFEKFFNWEAVFWLALLNDEVVGYHWSINEGFEGFYDLPMTGKDSVLVASEVFPEYRGQGINPRMINHIAHELKKEGITRLFIGSKVWNKAQLRSIAKTNFHELGTTRTLRIFGRFITVWQRKELKRNSENDKPAE